MMSRNRRVAVGLSLSTAHFYPSGELISSVIGCNSPLPCIIPSRSKRPRLTLALIFRVDAWVRQRPGSYRVKKRRLLRLREQARELSASCVLWSRVGEMKFKVYFTCQELSKVCTRQNDTRLRSRRYYLLRCSRSL